MRSEAYVLTGSQSLTVLGAGHKNCHGDGERRLKRKERDLKRSKKWQFLSQRKILTPTESICIGHCGYNKVVGIQYLFE